MKRLFVVAVFFVGCSQGEASKGDTTDRSPKEATDRDPGQATDRGPKEAPIACGTRLDNRAYVVSRDSDDLAVIDLDCLELIGSAKLETRAAHMAELNARYDELFVTSTGTEELVVVDTRALQVKQRSPLGQHPTHLTLSPDGRTLAVMLEGENAVSFVDSASRTEKARIPGFRTPHFLRYSKDGQQGFVANLNGNTVTRVDVNRFTVEEEIGLDGLPLDRSTDEDEGGFADAQVDTRGVLYAAHAQTGRVLVYDTNARKPLPEIAAKLSRPWAVFAEHPFQSLPNRHVVLSFGSATLSVIDGASQRIFASLPGDRQAYGVNYSPLEPDLAFVMNRVRRDVTIVDTKKNEVVDSLDVGGNTETASTSRDGRYVVATVSGADRVVVIDVPAKRIVKTFENVGRYPWSVVIPGGQNYCH